jgi:hypothetical protein
VQQEAWAAAPEFQNAAVAIVAASMNARTTPPFIMPSFATVRA